MKQTKLIFLLTALICGNLTYIFAQRNTKAEEETVTHLKKFRSDYIKSILEKKPEILQVYYTENIRLMVEFQKTVFGKSNVLMYHKAFSARLDTKSYDRKEFEILDLGSMVVEHGLFTMKVTSKSTGKEHELKGKYQNIWEKTESGKLSLITEGWNYDHQLDIGEQLRFEEVPVIDIALQPHVPINSHISFELAALNRLQEATISQHDAKIWSQFYADDGILFSQSHTLYEGRKAIDEYVEQHVKELPVFEKLDIRNDRIDDLGNYVIEYASHIANWRSGEYSGVGLGKDLRIWRREKNGSLKIFRHIGMYD